MGHEGGLDARLDRVEARTPPRSDLEIYPLNKGTASNGSDCEDGSDRIDFEKNRPSRFAGAGKMGKD